MARQSDPYSSHLFTLAAVTLGLASFYFAKEILLPVALAILLCFVLTPLVARLERLRFGRIPSVLAVVGVAFIFIGGVGWTVTDQVIALSGKLPEYKVNLIEKVRSLRGNTSSKLREATDTIEEIGEELAGEEPKQTSARPASSISSWLKSGFSSLPRQSSAEASSADEEKENAVAVKVVEMPPSPLAQLQSWLGPLVAPLTTGGIVICLVVFMLIQREDLRNRFLELCGTRNLHATTDALHDATSKVSRYLRVALLINTCYGVAVGTTLYYIGVPNAPLWGVLGLLLRFLPYVGPWLAAAMPISLSLAVFPGWMQPLLVVAVFVALELIVNNVLEPWLYGRSIGVSTLGVILAAIFWTWLWGPVGLVVAMPLTVCMVVAGRYIPHLRFLAILLGDRSTMTLEERVYQRLLAMDDDEVDKISMEHIKSASLPKFYDDVLLPALYLAERDRHAGLLTEEQESFMMSAARELVEELGESASESDGILCERPVAEKRRPQILIVAVRDQADEVVAAMLDQLLRRRGYDANIASSQLLTSEVVQTVEKEASQVVVLSGLPPLVGRKGRYLCKRLRERYPNLPVLVGFWKGESYTKTRDRLLAEGATGVTGSLAAAISQTQSLISRGLPIQHAVQSEAVA